MPFLTPACPRLGTTAPAPTPGRLMLQPRGAPSGCSEPRVDVLLSDLLYMLSSCSSLPPLKFLNSFEDHSNTTTSTPPPLTAANTARTFCGPRTISDTCIQTPHLQGGLRSHQTWSSAGIHHGLTTPDTYYILYTCFLSERRVRDKSHLAHARVHVHAHTRLHTVF